MKGLVSIIMVFCICLSSLCAEKNTQSKRKVWEIKTNGEKDYFSVIYTVQGKLLGIRKGKLIAYDCDSGNVLWKYPEKGRFASPSGLAGPPYISILTIVDGTAVMRLPGKWHRHAGESRIYSEGIVTVRLSDGKLVRFVHISKEYGFPDPGHIDRLCTFTRRGSHYGVYLAENRDYDSAQVLVPE